MTTTWADLGIELGGRTGEIDVTCPKCSSSRKNKRARCLSVNTEKGTFLCHHCDWRGSIARGEEGAARVERTYRLPELPPRTDLPREVARWFEGRGIPERVLERNGILSASIYFPQAEERRGAIGFPFYRGDQLINVKWRTRDKLFRMETGAERILYGLGDVAETTIIVEGEMDKLAVETAGMANCVSVPDGAPPPNAKDYTGKFSYLEADEDRLQVVKTWILAVDSDAPGKKLEEELSRRLGRNRCLRVEWPAGCKDANDVLVKHGHGRLRECIEAAHPYPVEGLIEVRDIAPKVKVILRGGLKGGEKTGWSSLDKLYTIRPGELTVITGIPNSGKSTWLDAMLCNLIDDLGWKFAICSPEHPIERHAATIARRLIGIPLGDPYWSDEKNADAAIDLVHEHVIFDSPKKPSIEQILDRATTAVYRRGIKGLVIDPWNQLEHRRPAGWSEGEYIGEVLGEISRWALQNDVHVWIVAHPTKLIKEKDGSYPVPSLYDISGSANWRNKADIGLIVWRDLADPDNPTTSIFVQKVRFDEVGRVGKCELVFDQALGRYRDPCDSQSRQNYTEPESLHDDSDPDDYRPTQSSLAFSGQDRAEGRLTPEQERDMRDYGAQFATGQDEVSF